MKPTNKQHSDLRKRKSFNRFVWIVILALCLCQLCHANPIALDIGSVISSLKEGDSIISRMIGIVLVDSLVDFCVLFVGFILIQKTHCLKKEKFVFYLFSVVVGGFVIDEISLLIMDTVDWSFLKSFVLTFLLLFSLNYFLCSRFYRFSKKEMGIVALLMASLTHPGFYIALSPLLFFGVLFFLLFYCRKPKILSPAVDVAPLQEYNRDIPFVKSPKIKTEPRCPSATEIGRIVLELSKLATNPESDQTQKEIIRLGRKLDFLPKISSNSNMVYAFRTILEFLGEKDAQKVAHVWEENGWLVRKWMSEDLYIL